MQSGLFPRSFVRNPDEGSQLVVPRKQLGPGGDDEADRLREQLAEAQRQLKQAGSSERTAELEQALAEAKKQAAAESQIAAELRKGKAALEGILAATGKATAPAGGASDSTLIEDLKAQLDKKKAEVADLTAKKNKYKKHARVSRRTLSSFSLFVAHCVWRSCIGGRHKAQRDEEEERVCGRRRRSGKCGRQWGRRWRRRGGSRGRD